MKLRQYIESKQLTPADVARALRVSHMSVSRYLRPGYRPRPKIILAIRAWTGGAVTEADWYDDEAGFRRAS